MSPRDRSVGAAGGRRSFETTHWTLVLAAAGRYDPVSREGPRKEHGQVRREMVAFRLDKGNYNMIIAELEAKTGRKAPRAIE